MWSLLEDLVCEGVKPEVGVVAQLRTGQAHAGADVFFWRVQGLGNLAFAYSFSFILIEIQVGGPHTIC